MKTVGRPQVRSPGDLISPMELARRLGVSRSGIQGMVDKGRLPHFRLGARVWFSEKAVMADMQRQAAERVKGRLVKFSTKVLVEEVKRRELGSAESESSSE